MVDDMNNSTYTDIMSAVIGEGECYDSADFPTQTAPKGCDVAYGFRSRRGWYSLEDKLKAKRGLVPAIVVKGEDVFICSAFAKMVDCDVDLYGSADHKIGRKSYYLYNEALVQRLIRAVSYFSDGTFSASKSRHTVGDTLDIASFVAVLTGTKVDGQDATPTSIINSYTR